MEHIGRIRPYLSSHGDSFVVEALGKNLDQALVKDALKETGRESNGSIILMDKNFLAYDFLWDIYCRGAEFLVRVKKNIKPKVFRTIAPGDEIFRLFTPILDEDVTHEDFKALYHDRWESETTLDEIKTHLCDCTTVNRPVIFRSKTPDRIVQELYGLMIAYNVIRKTMADAVAMEETSP